MRVRRIAVLIDGGFFLRRLPKLVSANSCATPEQIADLARILCRRHVQRITHCGTTGGTECFWLDHVYRLFYYDATPYDGAGHHPVLNRRVEFNKSATASFRRKLFSELRRQRKFALRLGKVIKQDDWRLSTRLTRQALRVGTWLEQLDLLQAEDESNPQLRISDIQLQELQKIIAAWRRIGEHDVSLDLRQKGVDMRIGLDIATMTLKHQVDTIVLVTGDSDFVPAAKLARREGIEFLLDPMWQRVSDELSEHVDGVACVFAKPAVEEPSRIAA